jgi:hypothetical protein
LLRREVSDYSEKKEEYQQSRPARRTAFMTGIVFAMILSSRIFKRKGIEANKESLE